MIDAMIWLTVIVSSMVIQSPEFNGLVLCRALRPCEFADLADGVDAPEGNEGWPLNDELADRLLDNVSPAANTSHNHAAFINHVHYAAQIPLRSFNMHMRLPRTPQPVAQNRRDTDRNRIPVEAASCGTDGELELRNSVPFSTLGESVSGPIVTTCSCRTEAC
jgi:hypothetical protein